MKVLILRKKELEINKFVKTKKRVVSGSHIPCNESGKPEINTVSQYLTPMCDTMMIDIHIDINHQNHFIAHG